MNAGTPKTGAWRGVVVVRHFVALRDESDLSLSATKVTHWSGAGRERSRILVQIDGHAAAKPCGNAGRSP
ncbi:hypothetical protein [Salmonella enterica]|uniref:hypothetical protein n=1 Tax=Salmonella enterica TaxID=28901 RepID=UPI00130039A5|nr:hypothetical protein [Salmonella enterica]